MRRRHVVVALPLHDVADANFDRIDPGQNVELGERERPHPVDASSVTREHGVEPSDAPRTSGGAAELVAFFAQRICEIAGELARKRSRADARRIALADAEHRVEVARPDAGAAEDRARDAIRRGHVRVGAVIDIEHRAVGALEQHALAGVDRLAHERARVAQIREQPAARFFHRVDRLVGLDRFGFEQCFQVGVLLDDIAAELLFEEFEIEQIFESQSHPRHLVFVGRADSESGRADCALAEPRLARAIDRKMIRHHHVRFVTDLEQAVVGEMAAALEVRDFAEQRDRIDHQPVADYASLAGMERAGRHESQNKFLSADHQRVRCVVSALEADDHVGVGREHIDDFALALIAPLRADHGNCLHVSPPTGVNLAGPCAHLSG